ncbi:MAG: hypothetical protein CM15mP79_1680 [Methanobacteriota archaeon]|nr:MAG: hypothetical protein CM15mP79_1680 [Euryarchaeota archaeon]
MPVNGDFWDRRSFKHAIGTNLSEDLEESSVTRHLRADVFTGVASDAIRFNQTFAMTDMEYPCSHLSVSDFGHP